MQCDPECNHLLVIPQALFCLVDLTTEPESHGQSHHLLFVGLLWGDDYTQLGNTFIFPPLCNSVMRLKGKHRFFHRKLASLTGGFLHHLCHEGLAAFNRQKCLDQNKEGKINK